MAVQTTYPSNLAAAYVGMIANTEPNTLISRDVQTAAIPFGRVVKPGTAANQVVAATAANDIVRGITVRDQSAVTTDAFGVNESALIMTQGVVWVTAGGTCTHGTAVYMIVGTADAGKFTSTSTDNLLIPGALFDTTASANALVKVRLGANI